MSNRSLYRGAFILGNLVDGDIYTGGDRLADDTYLTGDIKGRNVYWCCCQVVGNVQVTGMQVEDNAVVEGDIKSGRGCRYPESICQRMYLVQQ